MLDVEEKNKQFGIGNRKGHNRESSEGNSKKSGKTSKIVRLDNMGAQKWPGMEWIVEEDDSDQTFMREYRLRDVVGDLKKRVNDVEKM